MKEAVLYHKLGDAAVSCRLCSHRCTIKPGKRGICKVRENRGGTLYTLVFDKVVSLAADPIEKKPLYHFQPGSSSLSIATVGCNFRCLHCQNASISQMPKDHHGAVEGAAMAPESIVEEAVRRSCASISYTYTEPTVYFELASECGRIARKRGLKNVFVTNGYMTPETIEASLAFLDAANVDLKGFDDEKYVKICGARLQPVLDSIRGLHERGVWVEVTTLLIPGHNDDPGELERIARFLCSVSPAMPWHISAFHPAYRMLDRPPTDPAQVERAGRIGLEAGLRYVYCGNVRSTRFSGTCCWNCGKFVIRRSGFSILENSVPRGACPECGCAIDGVFEYGDPS